MNARQESAHRELSQAEHRLERLTTEESAAKNKLASMQKGGGSSQNLFAAGASEALAALEKARAAEQEIAALRAEAEETDQSAREALSEANKTSRN